MLKSIAIIQVPVVQRVDNFTLSTSRYPTEQFSFSFHVRPNFCKATHFTIDVLLLFPQIFPHFVSAGLQLIQWIVIHSFNNRGQVVKDVYYDERFVLETVLHKIIFCPFKELTKKKNREEQERESSRVNWVFM